MIQPADTFRRTGQNIILSGDGIRDVASSVRRVPPISTNRKLKPPTSLYLLLFIFLFLSFSRPLPLLHREVLLPSIVGSCRSSFTERIDTRVSDSRSRLYSTRLEIRLDRASVFFARERRRDKTTMTRRNREIDVTKRLKGNWHSREMHVAPNVYESTQSTLVTLLSQDESKPSKLRPAVPLASTASRPQRDDAMRACKGGGLLWLPRFSSDGDDPSRGGLWKFKRWDPSKQEWIKMDWNSFPNAYFK